MRDPLEITIHARAGQGSKTMAQFIAEAAALKEKHVQAFPYYGPVRGGAPMDAFVRISEKPIRIHSPIKKPDILIVLDETLITAQNICLDLAKEQMLLLNTRKTVKEVKKEYKCDAKIYIISASKIAYKQLKRDIANTVMLGALAKISNLIDIDDVLEVMRIKFMKKLGRELTDLNIKAVEEGYKSIQK
jgi:2-oxoacid:acceptor oxidoreductase gamma subunit (pyruvate/2-ketoisovalerate family)